MTTSTVAMASTAANDSGDELARAHRAAVDDWVRAAVTAGRGHASGFDDLLTALPGVWPPEVLAALDRLRASDALTRDEHARARRRTLETQAVAVQRYAATLPPEHPLDYDWRFSDDTADVLARCALRATGVSDTIVLLGAPTVLRALLELRPSRRAVLLDADAAVVDAVSAHATEPGGAGQRADVCDLGRDVLPPLLGACVVADPPWYPEHLRAFLWAAARLCRPGGTILLALPPPGTRPSVVAERRGVLAAARGYGLDLLAEHPSALAYATPPFERNALVAAGVADPPSGWRRGDLAWLRRRAGRVTVPRPPAPEDPTAWDEVIVRGVRVRVRRSARTRTRPAPVPAELLVPLVDGDVLTSVSRRDPRRHQVDVWTSGNRVYRSDATPVVRELLRAVAAGRDAPSAVGAHLRRPLALAERDTVSHALTRIERFVAVESRAQLRR